jgi:hypothetical protein
MSDYEKIVGIDLEEIQNGIALYCIYESNDGGNGWMPVLKSPNIVMLLEYAKARYDDTTPLVMQPHIQDIMLSQIVQEARQTKQKALQQNKPPRKNWFRRVWDFFRRR